MEEAGKPDSVLVPVAVGRAVPVDRNLEARFEVLLDRVSQNRSGEDLSPLRRAFASSNRIDAQLTIGVAPVVGCSGRVTVQNNPPRARTRRAEG